MLITSNNIYDPQVFNGLTSISTIIDYLVNGDKITHWKKNNEETCLNGIDKHFIMTVNSKNLDDNISLDTMSLSLKLERCFGYPDLNIKSII